jgi:hypothetical protein
MTYSACLSLIGNNMRQYIQNYSHALIIIGFSLVIASGIVLTQFVFDAHAQDGPSYDGPAGNGTGCGNPEGDPDPGDTPQDPCGYCGDRPGNGGTDPVPVCGPRDVCGREACNTVYPSVMTVNAGGDQSVALNTIMLQGSVNGIHTSMVENWSWSQVQGPGNAVVSNPVYTSTGNFSATLQATVTNLTPGTYTFELRVNAYDSAYFCPDPSVDRVVITVVAAPACSNGVDDNDPEDTLSDYPNDPGCTSPGDTDETNPGAVPPTGALIVESPIAANTTSDISWTSSGTTQCTVTGPDGDTISGGSTGFGQTKPLFVQSQYVLSCNNPSVVLDAKTIQVISRNVSISTRDKVVEEGGSATLNWNTDSIPASACTITGGGVSMQLQGSGTTGSTVVGNIKGTSTYLLTCAENGGNYADTVRVEVTPLHKET